MKLLTLDMAGYITDPSIIADRLMSNFFVSNYSQTNVHYGDIKSLPYLIYKHAEDMLGLQRAITSELESLLLSAFDRVNVDCTINDKSEELERIQIIVINATVYRGIHEYNLGKLIGLVRGRISTIEDI